MSAVTVGIKRRVLSAMDERFSSNDFVIAHRRFEFAMAFPFIWWRVRDSGVFERRMGGQNTCVEDSDDGSFAKVGVFHEAAFRVEV
ncbi:hypothetical protein IEQ34_018555 [Dendrobium chrysotoxum]|uniref:Uncharacterized protein n=1 Tax=Dendrobium chrysotoxum TaxID=161865 RepID=A0AAV7G4F5_DENCH|nr:hypothetical protein IEQ34_018555 [Dendrobium chrysotoxum]